MISRWLLSSLSICTWRPRILCFLSPPHKEKCWGYKNEASCSSKNQGWGRLPQRQNPTRICSLKHATRVAWNQGRVSLFFFWNSRSELAPFVTAIVFLFKSLAMRCAWAKQEVHRTQLKPLQLQDASKAFCNYRFCTFWNVHWVRQRHTLQFGCRCKRFNEWGKRFNEWGTKKNQHAKTLSWSTSYQPREVLCLLSLLLSRNEGIETRHWNCAINAWRSNCCLGAIAERLVLQLLFPPSLLSSKGCCFSQHVASFACGKPSTFANILRKGHPLGKTTMKFGQVAKLLDGQWHYALSPECSESMCLSCCHQTSTESSALYFWSKLLTPPCWITLDLVFICWEAHKGTKSSLRTDNILSRMFSTRGMLGWHKKR